MNRKKLSRKKPAQKNNKIIRCKNKMVPVFEHDLCEDFIKKENGESDTICKNCLYSF